MKDDRENLDEFFDKLELILGLKHWQSMVGGKERGIINYNYRRIDEDIFGKAYETFLAEVREEQGIYYTPKKITQYIVKSTVGEKFDAKKKKVEKCLDNNDFNNAKYALEDLINIKVVDSACGSGSFLIKAMRLIWHKYQRIIGALSEKRRAHQDFFGTLELSKEDKQVLNGISKLEEVLDYKNGRDLISKIILRHIYGNDLDARALDVANLNIWLEAIKLSPVEFRYDRIPKGQGYILPDLEMNLTHGDSLVGLPHEDVIKFLKENHTNNLDKLFQLRREYLKNPQNEEIIIEIREILAQIKTELNAEFNKYLKENDLPSEVTEKKLPFHWPLHFWHAYFDSHDSVADEPGFDCVIGNPPYINAIKRKKYFSPAENSYWKKRFDSSSGAYDLYLLFLELNMELSKNNGVISLIVPNKHLSSPYAEAFRTYVLKNDYRLEYVTNVAQLDVFEDPSVYPIIPIYRNTPPPKGADITVNSPPDMDHLGDAAFNRRHPYTRLRELEGNLWSFLLLDDETVFWKIHNRSKSLDEEGTVQASSTASESKEFTVAISESYPSDFKKKFIKTGAIDPYLSKWEVEEVPHQGKDWHKPVMDITSNNVTDLRREQYSKPKLIFAKIAMHIEAFPDTEAEYASVETNFFYDGKRDIRYYAALANSYVSNFQYLGLFGSLRMSGGDLQFQAPQLKLLPIPDEDLVPDSDVQKLCNQVDKITWKKDATEYFYHIFEEVTVKLKCTDKVLKTILEEDKRALQSGDYGKVWSKHVSFYPDQNKETLKRKFDQFFLSGKTDEPTIEIYGLKGQQEEKIYEIEFVNRDLMQIVFLSLKKLFDSREKMKNLNSIISKAEVPIIRPNIKENTPNIMRQVERRFKEWLEEREFEEETMADIVMMENEIQGIDNEIEAQIFDLYDLDREDVEAVLDALEVRKNKKNGILIEFDKLQ